MPPATDTHPLPPCIQPFDSRNWPVSRPFMRAGLVKTVAAALFPRCESALEDTDFVPHSCLLVLTMSLYAEPAYQRLPEAIDAGLLRAILILGQMEERFPRIDLRGYLQQLLREILPGALVYYPVLLVTIPRNIPALEAARDRARFEASAIFPDWLAFLDLLCQRVLVLQELEWSGHILCGVARKSAEIKRCSGCRMSHYCSTKCQVSAWREAGHREFCLPRQHRLSPNRLHFPRKRDYEFLRLIVLCDYKAYKVDILGAQFSFIHEHPYTKFCIVFDYTTGSGEVQIIPLADLPPAELPAASELWDANSPSGLHHVVVSAAASGVGGASPRRVALDFQLQSSTSAIYDGLVWLAVSIPRGVRIQQLGLTVRERIRMLSATEIVETYA
ncbi:hypothetical protein DFH09DRAFT_1404634 [Mycena vulgaris]|nr:hypothetical protein DFH09DRAFT_1404634 [Mycena vulgaris]